MDTYSTNKGIKYWAEEDRPREKLIQKGKSALSNAELLAIIIGSGSATETAVELSKRILKSVDNYLQELGKLSTAELTQFKGIGEAKAISIVAAMELGRRYISTQAKDRTQIKDSKDAFDLIYALLNNQMHEEFHIALLNRANKVIGIEKISEGGGANTIVDIKKILTVTLLKHASGIILYHNHPSGDLKPSATDIDITKQIVSAAKTMQINVIDHIIVGHNEYYSFKDENLI